MIGIPHIPFSHPLQLSDEEALERARRFALLMATRRTVREFSQRPVPQALIEQAIRAAATAPSGANQQPWRFVAVSDPLLKQKIRSSAEAEEREFYAHRAPPEWLQALAALGTNEDKPFLEIAPWLIAVFYERYSLDESGAKQKRYYPHESTGIACGLLIAALHRAGLSTLTHTPSPMGFLNELLDRPKNEMPYLLLVVGHAADVCSVPDIHRLPFEAVATFKV
ncbi:MAG TPA: nitroreductase family protein [Xanthomonadales bacterium]|nr:nitroreductase family protein [Xanthomonadales bacterium]